jgi:hypothetical protein
MADPELVRVLDFILNRSDENTIEAVAAAVVRRKRDLSMFGGPHKMPDPKTMAQERSGQINIGATIDGLKESVLDMAVRIIKQEAPELTDDQVAELTRAWIPGAGSGATRGDPGNGAAIPSGGNTGAGKKMPPDLLGAMVGQFISYSVGRMSPAEDEGLRAQMGAWPERYWKAFPQVVQLIITDFLNGEMTEGEFNSKIGTALSL